jgi:glyoxylase-like metal-dependent hydrolase (beta-lactamase superfamily II)/ferredoxin
MARLDQRHPANVAGDWFVDTRCIDCDSCRQIAPSLFSEGPTQSLVQRQPVGPAEELEAWLAAQTCPTQSIGTQARPRPPRPRLLPYPLGDDVHLCGHNSEDSFGANSFLVVREGGNLLVDSPRFSRELCGGIEALGGVAHVLLTHRDDVADADRYAERFGARVWIHEDDARAAPYATDLLRGHGDTEVADGVVAVPVPGHTRGSVVFVVDQRLLLSGDSLFWSRSRSDLGVHVGATWYSLAAQLDSLERLAGRHRFEWVLAGHGDRRRLPADEMHRRLTALVSRLRADHVRS